MIATAGALLVLTLIDFNREETSEWVIAFDSMEECREAQHNLPETPWDTVMVSECHKEQGL
jgi:hypothetical protein